MDSRNPSNSRDAVFVFFVVALLLSTSAAAGERSSLDDEESSNNCTAANLVIPPNEASVAVQINAQRFYPSFYHCPIYKQTTVYTCGPSSMWSALQALGFSNVTEESLAAEMHTNDTFGTLLSEMRDAADRRGLVTELVQNATAQDLWDTIGAGNLAIVLYEAWAEEYDTAGPNVWDSGHFSVVFGLDAANVYLMDPWMGAFGYIPWGQFLNERWHSPDPFGEFGICQRCFLGLGPSSSLPSELGHGQHLSAASPAGPQQTAVLTAVNRPDTLIFIE